MHLPARSGRSILQGQEPRAGNIGFEPHSWPAELVAHVWHRHLYVASAGIQCLGRPHAPPCDERSPTDAMHEDNVNIGCSCM